MNSPNIYSQPEEVVTVLVVNPFENECGVLRRILRGSRWAVHQVATCSEAAAHLSGQCTPVVVCERDLPDGDWKTLFAETAVLPAPPSFIVSSRLADEALWAEVLNLGGYDVLQTPFEPGELFRVLYLAWMAWRRQWGQASATPPKKLAGTAVLAAKSASAGRAPAGS